MAICPGQAFVPDFLVRVVGVELAVYEQVGEILLFDPHEGAGGREVVLPAVFELRPK